MWSFMKKKMQMPSAEEALPGRNEPMPVARRHSVLNTPMDGPVPEGDEFALFGLGCFWGAERRLWQVPGVFTTAVGYAGGHTANPTYEEVCSGRTGHVEVVRVVFDPKAVAFEHLLRIFWESHDPTQGMRQGNDVGTQYRSAIYCGTPRQLNLAQALMHQYTAALSAKGYGAITTEIAIAPQFYYAEDYHQQYLAKNPGGYCGLEGTGVSCPIGIGASEPA